LSTAFDFLPGPFLVYRLCLCVRALIISLRPPRLTTNRQWDALTEFCDIFSYPTFSNRHYCIQQPVVIRKCVGSHKPPTSTRPWLLTVIDFTTENSACQTCRRPNECLLLSDCNFSWTSCYFLPCDSAPRKLRSRSDMLLTQHRRNTNESTPKNWVGRNWTLISFFSPGMVENQRRKRAGEPAEATIGLETRCFHFDLRAYPHWTAPAAF
jgi:hypothetical protein